MHRTTRLATKADTLSAVALLASDGRHREDTTGSARPVASPVRGGLSTWPTRPAIPT